MLDMESRQARGEKQGSSKLKEFQVREIKEKLMSGISHSKIAEEYNVVKNTITSINRGRTWRHI